MQEESMMTVKRNLKQCQSPLQGWSQWKYGNLNELVKKKTKQLAQIQQREGDGDQEEIKKLQIEIDQLLEHQDIKWKQRAKQHWYQKGDKNTPFFHAWASHQRRINHIKQVQDDKNTEWTKPEEIGHAFVNFYQKLFQTKGIIGVDKCLEGLEPQVTSEINGWLFHRFEVEEVELALS